MKRVKCYGKVKKTVALEKSIVKDFFGDDDYKASLWDLDSPNKNDPGKENKPVKRAGRGKKDSFRYFFPSSPDMFTSSFCDTEVKLTSKKGKSEKSEIINKKIPESNKRILRKRLRDKNNDVDAYAGQVQPKWSEIEDHDLCLERLKQYENESVFVKCKSQIQGYDNLSSNKENELLDIIVLSRSPKPDDNILRKKSSRIKRQKKLKNSSNLINSKIHMESLQTDKMSVEQNFVINHSKELENLLTSPTSHVSLVQCQSQINSKQQSSEFDDGPENISANRKISKLIENSNSVKKPQYLINSKQLSSEFSTSFGSCVSRKMSNIFENSRIKNSQHQHNSMQQDSEFNTSPEPLCVYEENSDLHENSISTRSSKHQVSSKQQESELNTSPEPLYVNEKNSDLYKYSTSIKSSQDLINSMQQDSEFNNTTEPLCVNEKNSNLYKNSISIKDSQDLINSQQQDSEFNNSTEPLCVNKKNCDLSENSINIENSQCLNNSKQQPSEHNTSSESLCVNKEIGNLFETSICEENSQHFINSKQHSSELNASLEACVNKKISNLHGNSICMKNSQHQTHSKHYSSEFNKSPEPLSVDKKINNLFENSISMEKSKNLISSKQHSSAFNVSSEPLCDSTRMRNSQQLVCGKSQSSELNLSPEPLCVNRKMSILENNISMKNSSSQSLSTAAENISIHSPMHSNSDTILEPMLKNSQNAFSGSINMKNACSLLLPGEEQKSFDVNHTIEKFKNGLQSPVSFRMSPIHCDASEQESYKNYGSYCVTRSKSSVMTSTPFPKYKLSQCSGDSHLDAALSGGKELINVDKISRIMQLSDEEKQISCSFRLFSNLQVDQLQKSCLNLKAVIDVSNNTFSHYNISNLFANSKSSHSLCNSKVPDLSTSNVTRHSCTSKIAIQNASTTQSKCDIEEAKVKLLKLCKQDSVVKFSEVFEWRSLNIKKIGEGTYGEVFTITKGKTSSVLKIIPVSENIGDDSFQGLQNVLSEVKIAQCLSGLKTNKMNQTKNFNKLKSAHLVMGQYPDVLISAWDSFSDAKSTYNDRPDFFSDAQLFVILVQEYGGKDMSNFVLRHAVEAESVFKQIAISLAIAEEEYLFEHRDLHLGNILIQRNRSKKVSYILRGKPFTIESHGLLVMIIDFTLSRLCETEYVYYNNLADDEALFNQSGDYQFEIYKAMKEHLGNQWHECGLYSNVLWLNFLCVKLKTFPYSRPSTAKHKKALKQLESMEKQLSYCNSALDCLSQCKIVDFPILKQKRDTRLSSNSILVSRNSFQKSKASILP